MKIAKGFVFVGVILAILALVIGMVVILGGIVTATGQWAYTGISLVIWAFFWGALMTASYMLLFLGDDQG